MNPVVAEVVRSGFVEGRHHGSVVALDPDGGVLHQTGDVTSQILPRSCNKPIQAIGMLRAGLPLRGELLALAAASHSGEKIHVEGVRRALDEVGLTETDLQTPPDWPLDQGVRDEHLRHGGEKERILMNCSGKHAAMLATCVVNDWPTDSYLEVDHPLQKQLAETFAELTGEQIGTTAIDGCGAPLLSTSLTGLARAFSTIARAEQGPEKQLADAIRQHPEYVSGTTRDERDLLRAIPGAIGKIGAEGCYALALADGRAFALKIDDGAERARPVVMAALLRKLGVDTEPGVDTDAVRRTGEHLLHGGGEPVGEVRATI